MIKNILFTALFTVLSVSVVAEENAELSDASPEYIKSVVESCKEYAAEDEVDAKELKKYLLECVNDDLEGNDYKKLSVLPK